MYKAAVLTVSDKGYAGQREDLGGPLVARSLADAGYEVVAKEIVPDQQELIAKALIAWADETGADLIVTTGGTGFSPRDVTPEATMAVCSRLAPGIAEAMRAQSMKITPMAMLSRAAAGIRGRTLIVNLPGSPKAAGECLAVILPALGHGLAVLRGEAGDCARSE